MLAKDKEFNGEALGEFAAALTNREDVVAFGKETFAKPVDANGESYVGPALADFNSAYSFVRTSH